MTKQRHVEGAMALETKEGKLIALLVLPMNWEAVVDVMSALNKHFPNAMCRQATHYTIIRHGGDDG